MGRDKLPTYRPHPEMEKPHSILLLKPENIEQYRCKACPEDDQRKTRGRPKENMSEIDGKMG
jgi:hypothetical protein